MQFSLRPIFCTIKITVYGNRTKLVLTLQLENDNDITTVHRHAKFDMDMSQTNFQVQRETLLSAKKMATRA
jgi:hypothetical protein